MCLAELRPAQLRVDRAVAAAWDKLRQLPDEVEYFDPQVTGKIKITPRRLCGDFSLHHIEGA